MLRDTILETPEQWVWEAVVENEDALHLEYDRVVVCGMGGSHLAADIVASLHPELQITIHSDYGLPYISVPAKTLVIASSYSGNTEETLNAAEQARAEGVPLAVIASGGKLLAFAREYTVPYIALPALDIQPRYALGYSLVAHATMLGRDDVLHELRQINERFDNTALESMAETYAEALQKYTPVIYASNRNQAVAYNWKIKCNESGKVPAFYNLLPELNHNEMEGFSRFAGTEQLAEKFVIIALRDAADRPRIQDRFEALKEVYAAKGIEVLEVSLVGETHLEKMLFGISLADWMTWHLSQHFGYNPIPVDMVENFKAQLANQ